MSGSANMPNWQFDPTVPAVKPHEPLKPGLMMVLNWIILYPLILRWFIEIGSDENENQGFSTS